MTNIGALARDTELCSVRITFPGVDACETDEIATHAGRGHKLNEPVPVYSSEREDTARAEARHVHPALVNSPIRISILRGRVRLLDTFEEGVLDHWGYTLDDLSNPHDLSACQEVVSAAFAAGVEAVRVPSARDPDGVNVIVARAVAQKGGVGDGDWHEDEFL